MYRCPTKTSIPYLIELVNESKIDGLIATNTSISRENLTTSASKIKKIGNGGLSGAPIHSRSVEVIRFLRSKLAPEFPIIASGGIMSEQDALNSLEAGAQLVQLYTGFIYNGPKLIRKIVTRLG